MPTTSLGLTYPASTAHTRLWEHFQTLAQDVNTALTWVRKKPTAYLRQATVQSLANSVFVPITFDTEDVDTDPDGVGGHSTVTNPSRYTARYAGWYCLGGGVAFASNTTGLRHAVWAKNGAAINGSAIGVDATANSSSTRLPMRTISINLNVGDYVELWGWQGSGAALNTDATGSGQSSMFVTWISDL